MERNSLRKSRSPSSSRPPDASSPRPCATSPNAAGPRTNCAVLALTDALTGAANRRHFMERAAFEFARMRRYGNPVSLVMLDVDHFKRVNDTHGHAAGDAALILLVKCCKALLRDTDLVGRLGGRNSRCCCPTLRRMPLPGGRAGAARSGGPGNRRRGAAFSFTVSIGVACCEPVETSVEQTIGRANRALYRAKSEGRDRTLVAC